MKIRIPFKIMEELKENIFPLFKYDPIYKTMTPISPYTLSPIPKYYRISYTTTTNTTTKSEDIQFFPQYLYD